MTTIGELREALEDIPGPLLDQDDTRVLTETKTSLDALESLDIVPTVVVFAGSSGSGKSSLVNATLGTDVVPVGPIRPTTERVMMIGSSGPVSLSARSEYLHVPSVRPGLLVIDTPPWEHDPDGVESSVAAADLVAIVVTPLRYADAAVARLVARIDDGRPSALVLNRVDVDPEELEVLLTSVEERFGVVPLVVREGESMAQAATHLVEALRIDSVEYQRSAVLRSAAASGSTFLARRMGQVAVELQRLSAAVGRVGQDSTGFTGPLVLTDDWDTTRDALVRLAVAGAEALDDDILSRGGPLAPRVLDSLSPVDTEAAGRAFDAWRIDTTTAFSASATIRWRRRAAESTIERHGWRIAVHEGVKVPSRFRRMLGDRLATVADQQARRLRVEIDAVRTDRLQQWRTTIEELGDYAPGTLLAAARQFDRSDTHDG
ncbi:MAG: 50S ribosome-binding GTPase [Acidimicrobiia bacterium]|nr:50S ribosome-binding GTPase [Acidimicrobiia bacterium]